MPLFIKFPAGVQVASLFPDVNEHGQRVSDRNVESIDIAPTAAHVLRSAALLAHRWRIDARGLGSAPPGKTDRRWRREYGSAVRSRRPADRRGAAAGVSIRSAAPNMYRIPRPPRFGELVGHPVTDYRIVASPEIADLRHVSKYAQFDPDADSVPFDVSGDLRGRRKEDDPAYVAVAINGVIRAVTRTWASKSGWLATPPLDAWRRGGNSLEVFLIAESEAHPVLARLQRPTSPPEDLNLISGAAEHYWEVRLQGFRRHERMGRRPDSLDTGERFTRGTAARTEAFSDSPQDSARGGADHEAHRHGERVHALRRRGSEARVGGHAAAGGVRCGGRYAHRRTRHQRHSAEGSRRPEKTRSGGAARHPADG